MELLTVSTTAGGKITSFTPVRDTGIAGKGFYTLISTGRLSGNCTIIPGMTGSRNFSYIFFAVTACAVMALLPTVSQAAAVSMVQSEL